MLEDGGDTAGGRRLRARREILALGMTGVLEVPVQIDCARGDHEPGRVEHVVGIRQDVVVLAEGAYPVAFDHDVRPEDAVGSRHGAVGDDSLRPRRGRRCAHVPPHVSWRSRRLTEFPPLLFVQIQF